VLAAQQGRRMRTLYALARPCASPPGLARDRA